MIGFDLDGVFIGDIDLEGTCTLDELLKSRLNTKPTFIPSIEYYIITGRPSEDKTFTKDWIDKYFNTNRPLKVFNDNLDFRRASDYKIKVLKENPEIDTFIESDSRQASNIKKALPHLKVIVFNDLINNILKGNL